MTSTIPILYEDEQILAVDKPEGIASIPDRSPEKTDVLSVLSQQRGRPLLVVHRLDKDVSGVMVFAKTPEAHVALNQQFQGHQVEQTYLALVHGVVKAEMGQIDKPLRQFGSGRMGVDESQGKASLTTFKVKERFNRYSFVMAQPATARRHQIRVHLYSLGHPVVGDSLYGRPELQKGFSRLMLHSSEIQLTLLPGDKKIFSSPLPPSFRSVLPTQ